MKPGDLASRPRLGDIADILQPGQLLLVSRCDWKGWPIMKVTHSIWTHAAMIEQTAGGVWVVVEAVGAGVVGRRFEHYLEDAAYSALLIRDVPGADLLRRQAALQAMWLQVGQGYDLLGCLGIFVRRTLGLRVGERLDARNRKFCSEGYTYAWLGGAGLELVPGQVPGQVAPGDLATTGVLRDVWRWP